MSTTATPLREIELVSTRVKGCCNAVAAPLPRETALELARVHRAVGDPTRVQILHILKAASSPVCVCDFTAVFDLGQATISHHLARLREAGLVTAQRHGIWSFFALAGDLSPAAAAALAAIP